MKKHEIQIKPYFHVLDIDSCNEAYQSKINRWPVLLGDACNIMVCAEYKRVIEHKYIHFEYTNAYHHKVKLHKWFQKTIDNFSHEKLSDDIWIYDAGMTLMSAPYYWKKYGNRILPTISSDPDEYTGVEMDWGNYIVLSPLFADDDGFNYNVSRYFSVDFTNRLIDALFDKYGDKFVVVTDKPNKIKNEDVTLIVSENVYDILYIISKASTFIGGQTGFGHFAGLCKIPRLISLNPHRTYLERYYSSVGIPTNNEWDRWARVYSEMGQLKDEPLDNYPVYNTEFTTLRVYALSDGGVSEVDMDRIVNRDVVLC
jgi:hypothetical protein